ncbi:ribonuclease J [Desulfobotulus alkaliphilus]|uniref:Ribonuclease J n=1 Tax=Desulfobotulus alkaliphilus TaxID=622671 RepID=A0A562S7V2_9BACT|nr:ribonuclease J [Desulfobotulus alkaliphilus]TWI77243.1 ribonuclease J [Desulfobotulus alkaliphilus]
MLKIIPLGGLGEIGLNMMVFEYGDDVFVVDAGLMFPEDYMLGVDIVIPDMEYLKGNAHRVKAVVITHSHEDHIGALPYLLREISVPVYGTAFSIGMIQHKLSDFDYPIEADLRTVRPGDTLDIGVFSIRFIRVSHSTVDGVGLAIRTPLGLVVHTGDFRINHNSIDGMITDVNAFALCGKEGVLALLSDSTNVESKGYTISDESVGQTLEQLINDAPGRVIVALFASNVARIQQIVDIARKKNARVVINGRSMELSVRVARELGYLSFPEGMEMGLVEMGQACDEKVIMITTGSQGEPMSALSRMAEGNHKQIRIREGDTVILSSKSIPGNEKAITAIINSLYRRGANVIYNKMADVHVSGHAFQEELKLMMSLTKPRYFIPIHGEYRHLVHHARLAVETGIPKERVLLAENGQTVLFDEGGARMGNVVQSGRVLIDGKGIGDVGRSVLRERRILSEDGIAVVTMVIDQETGVVLYGPELISRGFVFWTETGHVLDDAQCVILEIVEDVGPEVSNRVEIIRARLQKALRQYFYFTIRRRPIILAQIFEV